ncbi:MAG: nitrobindin family protein [Actinomycetes bacterium]
MTFTIGDDLPALLVPLAWMVGRWEGAGIVGQPGAQSRRFGQEAEFSVGDGAFLRYRAISWELDDAGDLTRFLAEETGYWRILPEPSGEVEVLLAHPTGYLELWTGQVGSARLELRTDVVVRSPRAAEYNAGHRLYGLVDGDLLWAFDMAAGGPGLAAHSSARLRRVDGVGPLRPPPTLVT